MPRQKVTTKTKETTSPVWAMDELDRHALIAGGGFLKASDFTANSEGKRYVQSGTLVGRTWISQSGKEGFSPFDSAVHEIGESQVYLIAYDVEDAAEDAHCSLYRHGCQVRVQSLPNWDTLPESYKDRIRQLYEIV